METDEDLFDRWCSGDQHGGNQLFQRHFNTVRLYFANKVDDAVDVEELVQETFTACVESRDRFERRATFKAFLLGIARHRLYKRYHQRARSRLEDMEDMSIAALGASPSSAYGHKQEDKRLLQALRQIPLKHQEILELYFWEGMNGDELAAAVGLTEDGARSRIHRAKAALKKEYNRLERFACVNESTDEQLDEWARRVRGCVGGSA